MNAARFLILLVQVALALVALFGGKWALWFVIGAPFLASRLP